MAFVIIDAVELKLLARGVKVLCLTAWRRPSKKEKTAQQRCFIRF